ncbi:cytochrome c [Alisedimentitalea sp. MJ-SS2]|uniref:c-type cytochrome n=1 Tax=Aliisedimentitalea sp. MJ-SS2 TaxID=3049795 RepID=UPI0029126C8F|nr:c-type cytochrome [Alisedimentitalea sp. MJ-SS2]MDU8926322.1 cytochrome c [Alisedimentitalea sp. MJ-SS2]
MFSKMITPLAAISLCLLGSAAIAETAGEAEFRNSCAVCHGLDGTGNGPLSSVMKTAAPDLTQLTVNADGSFPMLHVVRVIDGRTGVGAHGSAMPDWAGGMPVWGDRFMTEAGDQYGTYGKELFVRGRVMVLADYIESIQK